MSQLGNSDPKNEINEGAKKSSLKDSNIESILNKRPTFIDNAYNKNLRQDTANSSALANANETGQLYSNSSKRISNVAEMYNNQSKTLLNQNGKGSLGNNFGNNISVSNSNMNLLNEKTFLSFSSLGDFADDSDLDEQDNDSLDGGISKYEDACHGLMIGTSSIVLKSLRTNSVILSNYGLNSVRVLALCNALKQNITVNKLDLSGNEIGTIGVKHLSNLLQENSSINVLNISKNFIGTGGVEHICEIFKKNRNLREVDLSNNDFNDDDGVILIESLDDNLMTKLNLSHNKFAEKSGIAIGKWIAENGNLLELNLGWNHIRKLAALAVAKGIWDNNKLVKINLSWNGFGNEGANALGKALAHNVMLEELDVRSNRIDTQGFLNLCSCFKENTTLKRLYVGRNIINSESVEAVLTMIKSLSKPLCLELLDISEVTLKTSIDEHITATTEIHSDFKCTYGFLNFGEKKIRIPSEDALSVIQVYCSKNNITLIDLFSKLDKDGSMSLTYEEFREGLKETGIEISPEKTDALLSFLDRDGDGEIDFRKIKDHI